MAVIRIFGILILLLLIATTALSQDTFTNPIIDGNSADPFVGRVGDSYYMLLSTKTEHELTIYKSSELTNFRNAESRVIFRAPPGYQNVWASEMHEMPDGNLYIYFAMGEIGDFNRNWAIRADDPNNPMGTWSEPIRLLPHLEQPGVDGTILKHNGKIYYVWSGRNGGTIPHDSILIEEMIDPVTTKNQTTIIRQPLLPWERNVNEGPFFIYNRNVSYLLFAASFTFSEYYCLGLMSIDDGLDPMVAENWWYGPEDGPVFYKNDEERVFGSGHASFITSPDGTETWCIYHASEDRERIEHYRIARAEKVEWDPQTGRPVFPRPHGYYSPIPLPSGQTRAAPKSTFTNPILSGDSPDPKVLLLGGTYYLSIADYSMESVKIHSSKTLTNFRNAISSTVSWNKGDCRLTEIWAPELKVVRGELYMYLSAKNCSNEPHAIYVSKALNSSDPLGAWSDLKRLLPSVDAITADGTVLERDGELYLVYESREEPYGLWIAEMSDPQTVQESSRTLLKTPTEGWEAGVVNGPATVKRGNKTWMTYSAGNPNGADYCTGIMSIEDGHSPLNPRNWDMKLDRPVFYKDTVEGVYGPGHVGFTTSLDERETWITYHAAEYSDRIFGNRISRAEKLEWTDRDEPIFPKPHGYFSPQPLPSGEATI